MYMCMTVCVYTHRAYTHLHQELEHTKKLNTNIYARNPVSRLRSIKIIINTLIKTQTKNDPILKEHPKSGGNHIIVR